MFYDLNPDIVNLIFNETVIIENTDEFAVFREKYNEFINIIGFTGIKFDKNPYGDIFRERQHEIVDDWICNYVYNELDQNQIDSILCCYGFNKAIVLIYNFHKIGCGDNRYEICKRIICNQRDRDMVELILKDDIEFMNW